MALLLLRSSPYGRILRPSCYKHFNHLSPVRHSHELKKFPRWLGRIYKRQSSNVSGGGERKVGYWLLVCCGMVSGSVIIGTHGG